MAFVSNLYWSYTNIADAIPQHMALLAANQDLASTIIFVVINPLVEEDYWRGLLLDAMTNTNKFLAVLYSSILFMINHLWISVMVIGARNPMASIFQFVFGVLMSITYLKTQSLRWPLVAHFLTNLFIPTVAVFLNLYVPASPLYRFLLTC